MINFKAFFAFLSQSSPKKRLHNWTIMHVQQQGMACVSRNRHDDQHKKRAFLVNQHDQ